jgi:large subunit ribosomal protein L33
MAKGRKLIVYLIPECENRSSHTHHYTTYKTSTMIRDHKKIRVKKFNPVKNKHEWFVEAKLPKHTK